MTVKNISFYNYFKNYILWLFIIFLLLGNDIKASFTEEREITENKIYVIFTPGGKKEDFADLRRHQSLYSINLRDAFNIGTPLSLFRQTFPTVKELRMSKGSFLGRCLSLIPTSMPNLEFLDLSQSGLSSSCFSHLHELQSLRIIDISGTCVTSRRHIDELLSQNDSLIIYMKELSNFPFRSINKDIYANNERVFLESYSFQTDRSSIVLY